MGHERAHCLSEAMHVKEPRIACCVSIGRSSRRDFEVEPFVSIVILKQDKIRRKGGLV